MPAPSQVSMRKFGDYDATRTAIYDNSLAAVQALPPVENSRYRLELGNVGYAGNPTFSTADHKQAMIQGTSMARRITGMYKLIDKASGNVVDSKQTTVAAVPYLTNQGTFVTDGTTSALSHQTRLLPGVYARVRANGVAESHVNLLPGTGVPHRINLDPETGVFKMTVGQAEIPAINLLKTLGATDEDMTAAWGRDLMAVNKKYDKPHYVEKLYEKFGPAGKRPDGLDVSAAVAERVSKYPLDPWVMRRTLGAPYERYGKDVLLATTKKLLNIAHGKAEPDDRDNPAFATVWGPEHLIPERLSRVGPVMSKILWQVTNSGSLKKLPTGVLTPAVRSVFTKSGLAQVPEGTSSLEFMDHGARLTKIGEGGIGKSAESIPDSARWVSSSQLPFIDPIRTSECFDPETQVMTERGWKPWPEVTADDLFACVVDGRLCFHKAIKLYDHEYTGTMYGAKNLYIDYLVTPNHRFYVTTVDTIARQQWRWVTADQVHNKSRMHRSSGFEPYAGDDKFTHFVLPEVEAFVPELPDQSEGSSRRTIGVRRLGVKEAMPIEPFCEFMGWYLAEGSLRAPDLGKTKAYQVVISQSETANPTKCDAIRKCLADLNITGFYAPSTNGFIFCGKQWVKYLLQFGFCDGKFIPEELFQAPPSARKRLFDSLLAGDGTTNQYGRIESLSTTSPRLAKDFARLAFSLGYSTSTSVFPDDRQARYLDNYRVTWHTRQQRLVRPEVNRLGKVRPGDYYTQEYSGKVYCATVPGGMLYVKRGDTPGFWSGNSDTIGVDLRTAFGTRLGSDKQIYAPLRDARTGKLVFKSPRDLADATVAFPDAHKSLEPMVPVVQGGKMTYAPKHAIDYIIPSMEQTFSPLTNLVPIKSASKPHRASMGARMSVSGGTVIVVARMDGTVYRGSIAEYQWMQGDKACSIDKESCEIVWKPVRGKITHDNVKRMYLVTFKSGRSVEATHDHSFVTMGHDGRLVKTHTQNLDRATVVPVAGRFNPPASEVRTWVVPDGIKHNSYPSMSFPLDYETGWVHGIYLSEGHLTLREAGHRNAGDVAFSTFANLEPAVYNRVADFFDSRGVKGKLVSGRSDGKIDRVVVAWRQLGEKLGIDFGNGSYEKAIPAWVLCAPEEYRKGLIGGYMAGDGTVVGRRSTMRAAAGSRSVMLRDGLCDVMLTLGIDASRSVTMVDTGPGGSTVPQYRFEIRAEHLDRVPLMGHPVKDTRMSEASWSGKRSADFFPVYADLRKILNKMLKRGSTFYNRVRSNKMIRQVATATLGIAGDTRAHRWLRSEVRWDKVDSVQEIDAAAYQQVYDLDLEDNVFMVNGGLFVHNTTQALPLVDVEAPLVRTEVPNQPGKSFEELFGRHIGAVHHRPDGPGLVTEVGPDHIKVRGHDGVEQVHEIYNNLPAGRKSGLHQDVLVKPGDVVGPGQLLAKSNYVDKNGHAAYGANLRVAFMAMKGQVYEDSMLISQSAANNKLKSDHLYRHDLEPDDTIKIGRAAHTSAFPGLHSLEKLKTVDDDGVVKPGTTVNKGDPLILAVKQKVGQYGRLSRSGKSGMADASEVWDHDEPGVVTDVHRTKNGPVVLVKSQKPAQSGDKISGRHGNKGVTNVLPDHEMPVDEQGRPVDMVISSLGTISRANPSAIFEAYLGKIAEKTGKPYVVPDFQHDQDIGKFVQGEGDKHGVKFLETLTDPKTGRPIPNVGVGNMYVMKLSHMASGKVKGRGLGGYDETGQPLRGQSGKAMRSSMGDSNALLSHGATSVIADAHNYKGQANDNFWVQYMSGYPAPRPVVSKAFDRFLTELKAAGIHPVREGSRYHLKAMTDKTINEMAGDRVVDNGETLDFSRNGEPYKGGLFDPSTFGSSDAADRWAKIPLHEPVLNPVFEEPTRRLLGLTEDKFRNVIAGKDSLPTGTGHKAIVDALRAYDVPKELAKVRLAADSNRKTARDEAYRKLGYLKHMSATKGSPADWVVSSVPVLPPAFRPVSQGPSGVVVNDQNMVYKDLLEANSALKDLHGVVADTGAERLNVYDAVKAAFGLGAPVSAKNQERQVKGVLERLLGQTSKYSYVQQKLLGTPVDLSGRGQVLPSPDLDLDQIGIPESMAWDVYHPFVVRRLVRAGVPRVEAARLVADKADRAKSAMIDEMGERPALATRYPALHRFNTLAFHPKLVKGDAIQTNSLINKGYNLDHDGDTMTISIPLSEDAVKEAYAKLLPSKNLFSPATMKATSYLPNMEYIAGLHAASTMDENNPHVTFKTKAEAISAYRAGHIGMGTRVRILEGEK